MTEKEKIFYSDGRYTVTARRLKTPRQSYRISRIEKVSLKRDPLFICLPFAIFLATFTYSYDFILYPGEKLFLYVAIGVLVLFGLTLGTLSVQSKAISEPAIIWLHGTLQKVRDAVDEAMEHFEHHGRRNRYYDDD